MGKCLSNDPWFTKFYVFFSLIGFLVNDFGGSTLSSFKFRAFKRFFFFSSAKILHTRVASVRVYICWRLYRKLIFYIF